MLILRFFILLISFNFCFGAFALNYKETNPFVVLIPGAGASGGEIYLDKLTKLAHSTGHKDYFQSYKKFLEDLDLSYMVCPKTPDLDKRKLTVRAKECVEEIRKLTLNSRPNVNRNIILLGHSMGGNIARLVADSASVKDFVHTVLTVSTPHRGTVLADFTYDHYFFGETSESEFYRQVMDLIGFTPVKKDYFREIFVERRWDDPDLYMAQDVQKNPLVNYYSISNYLGKTSLVPLKLTGKVIENELVRLGLDNGEFGVKNDGIIPTYSMVYGKHLASIKADHVAGLCIGVFKVTPGCKAMEKALKKALLAIQSKVSKSNYHLDPRENSNIGTIPE